MTTLTRLQARLDAIKFLRAKYESQHKYGLALKALTDERILRHQIDHEYQRLAISN